MKTDLTSTIFGADYRILEVPLGSSHSADEIRDIYTKLYQSILPKLFFRTEFRVNGIFTDSSGEPMAKCVVQRPG